MVILLAVSIDFKQQFILFTTSLILGSDYIILKII
jgi:hypothetical protein